MSTNESNTSLHKKITAETSEHNEMIERNVHTPIAELGGQTIHQFNKEMEEAEAEMDKGEFSTHEEVAEMFEKMFGK